MPEVKIEITVEVPRGEENFLGKAVSELQTDVEVNDTKVTGTLNYVEEFTEFNKSNSLEQEGNFIVLKVDEATKGKTVTAKITGTGAKGKLTTLDSDGILICKVANKDNKITFNIEDTSKTLDLTALELREKNN